METAADQAAADGFFPVFVVGASRSGTTMLARILGGNTKIAFCRELHFFEEMWVPQSDPLPISREDAQAMLDRLLGVQEKGYLRLTRAEAGNWAAEAGQILEALGPGPCYPHTLYAAFLRHVAAKEGKVAAVEQTPGYALYVEEILALYPQAKIIHIVRDPRDVFASQKHKWKRVKLGKDTSGFDRLEAFRAWANYHPSVTARLWSSAVCSIRRVEGDPRVMVVRFEDLAASPEAEVGRLCDFLGVPYTPDMLLVPASNSSKVTDRIDELGINSRLSRSVWREVLPGADVAICERLLGELMVDYGYPLSGISPRLTKHTPLLSLPIKVAISASLNLSRTRNLRRSIARRLRRPNRMQAGISN